MLVGVPQSLLLIATLQLTSTTHETNFHSYCVFRIVFFFPSYYVDYHPQKLYLMKAIPQYWN